MLRGNSFTAGLNCRERERLICSLDRIANKNIYILYNSFTDKAARRWHKAYRTRFTSGRAGVRSPLAADQVWSPYPSPQKKTGQTPRLQVAMKRQVFPPKGHVRWCRQYKPSTREDQKKQDKMDWIARKKGRGRSCQHNLRGERGILR